jgi:hypothetical protein
MFKLLILLILTLFIIDFFKEKNIEKQTPVAEEPINPDTFFDRKLGQCQPAQSSDQSICKVESNRPCKIEGKICFRTEKDDQDAMEYAYRKLCIEKGHCFIKNEDGSYQCTFTKEGCLNNSEKPKDARREALVDENGEGNLNYNYMEWRDGVGCVDGSGFKLIKKFCETDHPCGMGMLKYDSTNGTCKITPRYCAEMRMEYENGKCYPKDVIAEGIFGKSMVRGIISCPRYNDFWRDPKKTNSKDIQEHYQKALSDVCIAKSLE